MNTKGPTWNTSLPLSIGNKKETILEGRPSTLPSEGGTYVLLWYCIAVFYLCVSYRCRVHSLFQEIDKLAFIVKVCSDSISIGAQVVSLLVELLWDKALTSNNYKDVDGR